MKNKGIIMIIQLTILIVVMFPFTIFAAPSITSVGGNISNGQSVTITGSGFGNGPNIVFFDDFEKGTNGSRISIGSSTAQIGGYSSLSDGQNAYYSTDFHFSGTKAFKNDIYNGMSAAAIPLPTGVKEVFVSYNNYIPSSQKLPGEGGDGVNWKMIWLLGVLGDSGTTTSPTIFFVMNGIDSIHYGANDPDAGVFSDLYTGSTFVKGEWNFYSEWYKLGTSSNGGRYLTYKNSATRGTAGSNSASYTTSASTNDIRYVNLNGYARTTSGTSVYFDDVYVATGPNARARIEIGDAPTYANCTKIAIATALTWGDSQVTATLRQGSFVAGNSAYLYLIDSNGNISNGQQIIFGNSGSGSASAPAAPQNPKGIKQ